MKITEVEVVRVSPPRGAVVTPSGAGPVLGSAERALPLSSVEGFGVGALSETSGTRGPDIWVRVLADDGSWGLGRTGYGPPVAAVILSHFRPLLLGRDALATEYLNLIMTRSTARYGSGGIAAMGQSAIDLALWDLKGKYFGVPVYRLLGGPCRSRVPCYVTCDDVQWAVEHDYHTIKLSNRVRATDGKPGIESLVAQLASARALMGPGDELALNVIMVFDVEFTVRLAERVREFDLAWLEEPLLAQDFAGYRELRRRLPWLVLASGEDNHMRWEFQRLVDGRMVDIVQPDLEWCGGMTEALRIYHLCESAGVSFSPHLGANSPFGQHLAMALPQVGRLEYRVGPSKGRSTVEVESLPGWCLPSGGYVRPLDEPGFGFGIKEDWCESVEGLRW